MSSNSETSRNAFAAERSTLADRRYTYSLRRWNAFDAWQEHVRKYAASVGTAFSARDRDLRRTIVAG